MHGNIFRLILEPKSEQRDGRGREIGQNKTTEEGEIARGRDRKRERNRTNGRRSYSENHKKKNNHIFREK